MTSPFRFGSASGSEVPLASSSGVPDFHHSIIPGSTSASIPDDSLKRKRSIDQANASGRELAQELPSAKVSRGDYTNSDKLRMPAGSLTAGLLPRENSNGVVVHNSGLHIPYRESSLVLASYPPSSQSQ
jgi:hypothetical protein